MDKLRKVLSGNEDADDDSSTGIMADISSATTLSWSSRIQAFIICFVLGILMSLLGSLSMFLHKGLALFAVFYTLGNVISLASTCFLMGPFKQLKKMFAETRLIATVVTIIMMILTLFAGLGLKNPPLALLCMILQFLSMTWYSLSYIPYARDMVKKTLTTCIA
ncbi:unnamed protein product [Bemisia tabaci]|uniref:Vesicle transport protein n=1 Tax=Bemisia tabaci TaxID=7038 RepID=A0A9P0F7X7_BEMTA|nr:PREDICTED: vesicle transport protein SFT2A [Bemisia tabaci]XP_018910196.1 PREDICTED: vesicle transport protein SFT2A [Bemisia tabaci]CAH0395786.1 unnamed protein product [Bemisia tabaci]